VVVGGSDYGRSGIIQDPRTRRLSIVSPKTTQWLGSNVQPAIAEHVSTDLGSSWEIEGVHEVA